MPTTVALTNVYKLKHTFKYSIILVTRREKRTTWQRCAHFAVGLLEFSTFLCQIKNDLKLYFGVKITFLLFFTCILSNNFRCFPILLLCIRIFIYCSSTMSLKITLLLRLLVCSHILPLHIRLYNFTLCLLHYALYYYFFQISSNFSN